MIPTSRRLGHLLALTLLTVVGTTLAVVLVPAAAAATASQQAWASPASTTRPTLRYGSRGAAVAYLQQRLATLRYDVGPVDGSFGSGTLHGVDAFQKVQGIGVDGVVGPATWSRLASPSVPRARYARSTAAVEVNLTRRVVYLTRSGGVTRILDASPGAAWLPTPTGSFWIFRGSMAGGTVGLGCCGGPTTSPVATRCTGRRRADLPGQPRLRARDHPSDEPRLVAAVRGRAALRLPVTPAGTPRPSSEF